MQTHVQQLKVNCNFCGINGTCIYIYLSKYCSNRIEYVPKYRQYLQKK